MRGLQNALAPVLCLGLLSACVGVSATGFQSVASRTTTTEIDFVEIATHAGRAKAAYATEAEIRALYPRTIHVSSVGGTEVQYFLERDDAGKTQYLSVRGTQNKKNFVEDIKVRKRRDQRLGIPVHAGFDLAAEAVYRDAQAHLKPAYKTVVTGHSLGGAIAALLALYLIEDGYKVERVVTFGQPRFTTTEGARHLGDVPIFRVVDENDLVPMVPPGSALNPAHGRYEHVGPEVILLEGRHYVYLPAHDATRLSVGEFWRLSSLANLQDHAMDRYLARVAAKKSGALQVPYDERQKYVAAQSAQSAGR